MDIDISSVKDLRQKTGAGIMDCKRALKETQGNVDKAIEFLRQKGLAKAAKRGERTADEGLIGSYIHPGGRIGVLVEVNCETDFVARTQEFKDFVKDISMQIAAADPQYLTREDIPKEVIQKEKHILRMQALEMGKPDKVVDRIVVGKMERFFSEVCLLEQAYVKDLDLSVEDLLKSLTGKIGERISIRRFTRYQLGEEASDRAI
ncbi:MAG: translation elongation factor Ts [Syntrophobacterales bacterium]|nr:MAG: translation elongation factor Ts [Syntrophobacterales bacterium]